METTSRPLSGRSEVAAIEGHRADRVQVDAVEAAHIDGHGLGPVRHGTAREGFHAAARAEQVADRLAAELVLRQRVLARPQLEPRGRDEGPEEAALGADRATAGDHLAEVGVTS